MWQYQVVFSKDLMNLTVLGTLWISLKHQKKKKEQILKIVSKDVPLT